jgi:hypothetical protein
MPFGQTRYNTDSKDSSHRVRFHIWNSPSRVSRCLAFFHPEIWLGLSDSMEDSLADL